MNNDGLRKGRHAETLRRVRFFSRPDNHRRRFVGEPFELENKRQGSGRQVGDDVNTGTIRDGCRENGTVRRGRDDGHAREYAAGAVADSAANRTCEIAILRSRHLPRSGNRSGEEYCKNGK
jgi:hypothetical protein